MAGNAFDEMKYMKGHGATTDHHTGTLSTATAATVTLATEGWWKLSCDEDFWWRGPDAASTAVTASTGSHEWAKDTPPYFFVTSDNKYVSVLAVSTTGIYYIDRVKGP